VESEVVRSPLSLGNVFVILSLFGLWWYGFPWLWLSRGAPPEWAAARISGAGGLVQKAFQGVIGSSKIWCPVALCVVTDPAGGAGLPSSRGLAMSRRFLSAGDRFLQDQVSGRAVRRHRPCRRGRVSFKPRVGDVAPLCTSPLRCACCPCARLCRCVVNQRRSPL